MITVVTPLSRLLNLPALEETVAAMRAASRWPVRWYVVFDPAVAPRPVLGAWRTGSASGNNAFGNAARNRAIDDIDAGWVYFLDDDNTVHPTLVPALYRAADDSTAPGFVVRLLNRDGSERLPARPDAGVGEIDTAQFVWDRSAIGGVRWELNRYDADGDFFYQVRARAGVPRIAAGGAAYYNALRGG
ncbi:glycosyltransferase [Gemmata sp.]|uniref:glycosyltransferase n=1 Tax=Gemmata sp. TaxID=1914242 RepID=UPI003F724845